MEALHLQLASIHCRHNPTLLGSVANLIVAESARRQGVILKFGEYLKAGIPITILTIVLGVLWLSRFY